MQIKISVKGCLPIRPMSLLKLRSHFLALGLGPETNRLRLLLGEVFLRRIRNQLPATPAFPHKLGSNILNELKFKRFIHLSLAVLISGYQEEKERNVKILSIKIDFGSLFNYIFREIVLTVNSLTKLSTFPLF